MDIYESLNSILVTLFNDIMNIEEKLTTSIISAIKTLYGQDVPGKMVQLQKTKKEFEGHYFGCFPFSENV